MPVVVRPLEAGLRSEHSEAQSTIRVAAWHDASLHLPASGTHFGVALDGPARLAYAGNQYPLAPNAYFAAPGAAQLHGGRGLVVSHGDYRGLFQLGAPVEPSGRLRYIDGCSDTLLVAPTRRGEPCLNLLHVPPDTDQTAHTHPSIRIGLVLSGSGLCRTPQHDHTLTAGSVFELPAGAVHSFHTSGDELLIVAYHPDSDFGPTDESHPMLNKTFVGGRSLRRPTVGGAP